MNIQHRIFEKCGNYCSKLIINDYKVQKTNMEGTSLDILYKISRTSKIDHISLKIGKVINVEELNESDFFKGLYIELVPLLRELNIDNLLS